MVKKRNVIVTLKELAPKNHQGVSVDPLEHLQREMMVRRVLHDPSNIKGGFFLAQKALKTSNSYLANLSLSFGIGSSSHLGKGGEVKVFTLPFFPKNKH